MKGSRFSILDTRFSQESRIESRIETRNRLSTYFWTVLYLIAILEQYMLLVKPKLIKILSTAAKTKTKKYSRAANSGLGHSHITYTYHGRANRKAKTSTSYYLSLCWLLEIMWQLSYNNKQYSDDSLISAMPTQKFKKKTTRLCSF